jgi:hypothetical protein
MRSEPKKSNANLLSEPEQLELPMDEPEPEPGSNAFLNPQGILVSDDDLWLLGGLNEHTN